MPLEPIPQRPKAKTILPKPILIIDIGSPDSAEAYSAMFDLFSKDNLPDVYINYAVIVHPSDKVGVSFTIMNP